VNWLDRFAGYRIVTPLASGLATLIGVGVGSANQLAVFAARHLSMRANVRGVGTGSPQRSTQGCGDHQRQNANCT
jgi:hypothetical protein